MTTEQAVKYNISDGKAETFDDLIIKLNYSKYKVKQNIENWSENLVRFLTNPVVASLLTTFGFLGILFELQSPGWGIPGFVGLVCLILSLSASYIAQLATIPDLLLIITGFTLIMLEAFVIPGFGIVGISGLGVIIYGLYLLLIPDVPVSEEVLGSAMDGFTIGLLGALVGIYFLLKVMIKTKFWEQLTAPGSQKKEDGFTNSFGWETLVNEVGKTDTDLNPSGWVTVKKNRVFVVSEGGFIDKGKSVKILSVDGNRILVRKL